MFRGGALGEQSGRGGGGFRGFFPGGGGGRGGRGCLVHQKPTGVGGAGENFVFFLGRGAFCRDNPKIGAPKMFGGGYFYNPGAYGGGAFKKKKKRFV